MKVIICLVLCLAGVNALSKQDAPSSMTPDVPLKRQPGTTADRTRLTENLLKGYKKIIPDDVSVAFGITLFDYQVLEDKQALATQAWISEEWADHRLSWNPEDYGGVTQLSWDADWVWRPDINLYNSKDTATMMRCWNSNVVIKSNGTVAWIPTCSMESNCKFDLAKDPFAETTCTLKFGAWTYNGLEMDVNLKSDKIETSELWTSSDFEIVKNEAKKNVNVYPGYPEPYLDLAFKLTLKRIQTEL